MLQNLIDYLKDISKDEKLTEIFLKDGKGLDKKTSLIASYGQPDKTDSRAGSGVSNGAATVKKYLAMTEDDI